MGFEDNPADEDEHGLCRHEIEAKQRTIEIQQQESANDLANIRKLLEENAGLVQRAENAEAEVSRLKAAIKGIDHMLRIPAAEYVPAIGDVFTIIDRLKLSR